MVDAARLDFPEFGNDGAAVHAFHRALLLCAAKKKYLAAGIAAACAGFTRSPGVLLAVPLAIEGIGYCVRRARSGKKSVRRLRKLCFRLLYRLSARLPIFT